jgi:hypothetical protein
MSSIHSNHTQLHLPGPKSLEFLQSLLLTQICLVFSGSMKVVMRMQIETNLLVHLCSRMPADSTLPDVDGMEKEWLSWIYGESRTRLLHCIFRKSLDFS